MRSVLVMLGVTAVVAATAACGSSSGTTADPAAPVIKNFTSYSSAVTAKDGETAADLMSASSVNYYDGVRDLALDADEKTLTARPLIDQLTTLTMRADMKAADLRTLSPHDLVKKAVEINLISNAATPEQGLQQVTIEKNTATAQLVMAEGAQYPVRFERENGQWKFDVTSLLDPAESAMSQARAQQKLSERKLIDQVLAARFGKSKVTQLYDPLGR